MEIRVTLVTPRRFRAHANFMWTMKVQIFPTSSSVLRFYRTRSGLFRICHCIFLRSARFCMFLLRFTFRASTTFYTFYVSSEMPNVYTDYSTPILRQLFRNIYQEQAK